MLQWCSVHAHEYTDTSTGRTRVGGLLRFEEVVDLVVVDLQARGRDRRGLIALQGIEDLPWCTRTHTAVTVNVSELLTDTGACSSLTIKDLRVR